MPTFLDDLGLAARRLLATPGFSLGAVLSVALGVGIASTTFSAANTLLLQPMRTPHAEGLVRVYSGRHSPFGAERFAEVRERARSFSQLFAETQVSGALTVGGGEPERVRVGLMSGNTLAALELVPALGRLFALPDDRMPNQVSQAVLTYAFWQRRFGGDSSVVGQQVRINDRPFEVIGVGPVGFASSQVGWASDVMVPMADVRALLGVAPDSVNQSVYVTGRLATGRTIDEAQAELTSMAQQMRQRDSVEARNFTMLVRPARGVTEELRLPAAVGATFVLVVSLLVLVIAATNVGNLTLARNAARQRELGVRLALGASTGRLLRLLACESLVLAVVSGAGAMLITSWGSDLLPRLLPAGGEIWFAVVPDWRVGAFTIGVTFAALLLFGVIPARQVVRRDLAAGIRLASATGGGLQGARLRRRFLLVQVALCALLLATSSLFLRGLGRASQVPLGFNPQGVLVADIDLAGSRLTEAQRTAFFDRVLRDARQLPGVERATLSRILELTTANAETRVLADGAAGDSSARPTYFNAAGPEYHRTLGIPLVRGRDVAEGDVEGAPRVVVVNEVLAARTWPGQDPIGRRLSFSGSEGPWFEVVGLARTAKYHTLGEDPKPFVVIPLAQDGAPRSAWLELRTVEGASAQEIGKRVVELVRSLDPSLAPPRPQLMVDAQRVSLLGAQLAAGLFGGIGLLAFMLAALGVGGVAAYTITQRTREIGVRVALGAPRGALVRGVLGDTWRTIAAGAVVGLALALGVAKVIEGQLHGVSAADPVTFIAVPLLLSLMGMVAVIAPARRALSVPPSEALRSE